MKYTYLIIIIVTLWSCATKQVDKKKQKSVSFTTIATLPNAINESSGLITIGGDLYTHNDSGGGAYLYKIDTLGHLLETYQYNYLYNTDWESITQSKNYIHIADMGNNYGNRKDLKLYNIHKQDIKNTFTEPDITTWSYRDQLDFSKRPQNHKHDAEAIVRIKDRFYVFTKNWIDYTTSIYPVFPNEDHPVDSIKTIDVNGLITDATYNGHDRVVLCGYNTSLSPFIVVLSYINGQFELEQKIDLPIDGAQIEAISYHHTSKKGEIYYLTSEAVNTTIDQSEEEISGELYQLILPIKK